MAVEIERKFLIRSDAWRHSARDAQAIKQGYLSTDKHRTVRVRTVADQAYLTIKGAPKGLTRLEFEYEIPYSDAAELLLLCDTCIEKTRHIVEHSGFIWTVDVFHGANAGLTLAEIELADENELFIAPPWVDLEVTDDPKYLNSSLSRRPYTEWHESERP